MDNIVQKALGFLSSQAQKAGNVVAQPMIDYSNYLQGGMTRPEMINKLTQSTLNNPLIGGITMESVKPKFYLTSDETKKVLDIARGQILNPNKSNLDLEGIKTVNKVIKQAYPEHVSQGKMNIQRAIELATQLAKESALYRYVSSGGGVNKIPK